VILTTNVSCTGLGSAICMLGNNYSYSGAGAVLPPSGIYQCLWTGGFSQGSTSITLSSCGGTPPLNAILVLDQANDTSDTNGVYICDGSTKNCTYEGVRNSPGRVINGVQYSEQQVVYTTGVTSLGGGSYSVTISPGIANTNIRAGQTPGAWWPGFVQNDGLENLTIDGALAANGTLTMFSCYECWARNVAFLNGARNSVMLYQSLRDVVRDSYFYGAQSSAQTSYNIESDTSSSFLVENNIMQQVTTPININGGSVGSVVGYNFAVKTIFETGVSPWPIFASHSNGNNFNLLEGNVANGSWMDNASGPSDQTTIFRNLFAGWQAASTGSTIPFHFLALNRNINFIGNILGQPSYHNQYQTYATSTSTGTGAASENTSIYSLGWGGTGPTCTYSSGQSTICDPLTFSTAMRWGNYDVVNAAVRWDSTEASPGAVTYVSANFTSAYFGSLAHTLPASLYYNTKPSWWPSGKAWPATGPDVSSGNVGICTGTYAGSQATSAGQCTGGTLSSAWASHVTSIPAQDCYLNVMGGPPDGSGSVLNFDANVCYASAGSPTGVSVRTQ
jgi:hypothetical protein